MSRYIPPEEMNEAQIREQLDAEYKARGLHWHDPQAEEDYQMHVVKGYTKRQLGSKEVWCDKNGAAVKEVGFSVQNQR